MGGWVHMGVGVLGSGVCCIDSLDGWVLLWLVLLVFVMVGGCYWIRLLGDLVLLAWVW